MSAFANKVRACDKFGAPVQFNYKGKDTYETIVGGVVSGLLRLLIFVYICMKLAAVFGY